MLRSLEKSWLGSPVLGQGRALAGKPDCVNSGAPKRKLTPWMGPGRGVWKGKGKKQGIAEIPVLDLTDALITGNSYKWWQYTEQIWKRQKGTRLRDTHLLVENHGWDYQKQLLGVLCFSPMDWITARDILHFQFLCFGWPRKSHGFALWQTHAFRKTCYFCCSALPCLYGRLALSKI